MKKRRRSGSWRCYSIFRLVWARNFRFFWELALSILYNPFILSLSFFLFLFGWWETEAKKRKKKKKSDFCYWFCCVSIFWNRKNHLHETTKFVNSHCYAWKTKKAVCFLIFKASRFKLLSPSPFLSFSFTFSAAKQHSQQLFNTPA